MGFRPNCFTCIAHLYLYYTLLVPHTYASYIRHWCIFFHSRNTIQSSSISNKSHEVTMQTTPTCKLQIHNWSNVCSGDANGSGLCNVKLLNDGGCRSRTQGRWLDDVGGSTAKGCGGCCDGGSDVEKGVTLIKTRLLRKGQSSGSDTMLEILEDLYCIS